MFQSSSRIRFPELLKMSINYNRLFLFLMCLGCFVSSSLVQAADGAAVERDNGITWQLDVGLAIQQSEGLIDSLSDDDGDVNLAVLLSGGLYYDKFFLEASPFGRHPLTLGYTLKETASSRLNLIGLPWFSTISAEDQKRGNRLDGLSTRNASFEVGVEYIKQFPKSDVRVRLLHDSLGKHDGYLLSFDYSRPVFTTDWLILPSWGVSYLSDKSVDYYYGIRPSEATLDRPEYQPGSGWGLTARLYVERPLWQDWTLFGFASYSKFSNSISDSPIVSADNGTHVIAVGVLWSF